MRLTDTPKCRLILVKGRGINLQFGITDGGHAYGGLVRVRSPFLVRPDTAPDTTRDHPVAITERVAEIEGWLARDRERALEREKEGPEKGEEETPGSSRRVRGREDGLYIACLVEPHCLPVRTAQILPPSPEQRLRPYGTTYANSRIICARVRRYVGKWRVGISDKALPARVTPLTRARRRRWRRSYKG